MFFYIVLTPISITSGLCSTGNTRKYHQIDVYIYQCVHECILNYLFLKWQSCVDHQRLLGDQGDSIQVPPKLCGTVLRGLRPLDCLYLSLRIPNAKHLQTKQSTTKLTNCLSLPLRIKCLALGPEVIKLFSCSTQLSTKFYPAHNVKMPTIVCSLGALCCVPDTSQ